jgi:hypothetical protein
MTISMVSYLRQIAIKDWFPHKRCKTILTDSKLLRLVRGDKKTSNIHVTLQIIKIR